MIEQKLIEIAACHLVSVIGLRAITVFKVKLRSAIGARAHDFAAVFFYEPGIFKFLVQPEPGERFHAERQQRLSDVEARKFFPLENNDSASCACEQRRSCAAGRSTSYDRD